MQLDTFCPVASGSRSDWPIETDRPPSLRQRYLDTLFLPEVLAPIAFFATEAGSEEIVPLLLTLAEIEQRHRKQIFPVLSALTSGKGAEDIPDLEVITAALNLRLGCRAVVEGNGVVNPRKLADELEKRE